MTLRELLLRAYPRSWRQEYGEEMADILAQSRLNLALMSNVLRSAAIQRWRRTEPWKKYALLQIAVECVLFGPALLLAFADPSFFQHLPRSMMRSGSYSVWDAFDLLGFFALCGPTFAHSRCSPWNCGMSCGLALTLCYTNLARQQRGSRLAGTCSSNCRRPFWQDGPADSYPAV